MSGPQQDRHRGRRDRGQHLRALPPPNSRAVSPLTTTVAHAASAGHTRSPGSDTPNSFSDTHASSGASTG